MIKLIFAFLIILSANSLKAQSTLVETFSFEGITRSYRLYLPANYVNNSVQPLIIHFHGYSANASIDQEYTQWMPIADTAGFLVAYPNGLTDNSGNQYWNVGWSWEPNTNDVGFVSALIDSLHSRHNIDLNRVYAAGLSNGGFMSYMLAAKLSNKITAAASVSGSMVPSVFDTMVPQRAVPILEIHGTSDDLVPYEGNNGTFASVNIDTLVRFWAENDLCDTIADSSALPDLDNTDGSTVQLFRYSGGTANAECRLYRIVGGEHLDWPGAGTSDNGDFSAGSVIWNFFNQYQLSDFVGVESVVATGNEITIFPQPATDYVTILLPRSLSNAQSVNVSLVNSLGEVVENDMAKPLSSELRVNVSGLPTGFYLLQLKSSHGVSIVKLIKDNE